MIQTVPFRFVLGFFLAGSLSFALMRWVAPRGWMDHPEGRKSHTRPTPLTGGMALWGSLALAYLGGILRLPITPTEALACGVMAFLGMMDDRLELSSKTKALVGLGVACLLAYETAVALGAKQASIPLFGFPLPTTFPVTFALALLWYWAIPQAVNLVDGINGLSIGLLGLLVAASGLGLSPASGAFWGGLLAVFLLNFPRARHFQGDCGALGLGTLAAILVMRRALQVDAGLALWTSAYLVADVTMVVLIRWLNDRPLGTGDRNHLHHAALRVLGGRVWVATPLLLAVAALPMLRITGGAAASTASWIGLLLLAGLATANIWTKHPRRAHRLTVSLPVPPLTREPSGSYRAEFSDR